MELTTEQKNILDYIKTGNDLICQASAGCGKSSTLFEILKAVPEKQALVLSFNASIKNDNIKKVEQLGLENVHIMTFHGLGWNSIPVKKKRVSTGKLWYTLLNLDKKDVPNSSKLGTYYYLLDNLRSKALYSTFEDFKDCLMCGEYMPFPTVTKREIEFLYQVNTLLDNDEQYFDFSDMCRIPLIFDCLKCYSDMFDLITVDECQDLNDLQLAMLRDLFKYNPKAQRIIVGDQKQGIYSFRGAVDSFEKIEMMIPDAKVLPLSVTFRCPTVITKFVNMKCKESKMTAFIDGGKVTRLSLTDLPNNEDWGVHHWKDMNVDMVISSRNSMLIGLWITLFKLDIPSHFKGEALVDSLIKVASGIQTNDWQQVMSKLRFMSRPKVGDYDENSDYAQSLLEIIRRFHITQKFELFEILDKIKDSSKDSIQLETIWGAKGREANTVLFLWDFWTKVQKDNQMYVALTRAKEHLIVAYY